MCQLPRKDGNVPSLSSCPMDESHMTDSRMMVSWLQQGKGARMTFPGTEFLRKYS